MNKPVRHDRSLSLSQPPTEQTETIASIGLLNNTDANMTRDVADQVIMAARAHWFEATD